MRDPFSRRFPDSRVPNAWAEAVAARRRSGEPLIDLAESNPTRVGLPALAAGPTSTHGIDLGNTYEPDPRGLESARVAVARVVAERHGPVDPDDVVITTGTSESLAHLFRLLGDPGRTILVPRPGYPLFEPIAVAEGLRAAPYRLAWDGAWHLDREALREGLASAPRAVALVEPNLPTGTRLDGADWDFVEEGAARAGVPLIVDEVFAEFAWDSGAGFPGRVPADRGLSFLLGGASKSCGLPQLKLGWIVLRGDPGLRARARAGLEWISDLFLSPSPALQRALPGLLARRDAFQRPLRDRLATNRDALDAWVARYPEVTRLDADGGWVAILRLPERLSDEAWALECVRRGVAVHPGHFYDLELPATVVVSLIVAPGALREGLERLGDALASG